MDADEVRALLDPDEPDYDAAALLLGPHDVEHLRTLVAGDDPMLASKAAYVTGMVDRGPTAEVLARAAAAEDVTVRVAAAATLRNVDADTAVEIGARLLEDPDEGVQRMVVDAAAESRFGEVGRRLRPVVDAHPNAAVRGQAERLGERDGPP